MRCALVPWQCAQRRQGAGAKEVCVVFMYSVMGMIRHLPSDLLYCVSLSSPDHHHHHHRHHHHIIMIITITIIIICAG